MKTLTVDYDEKDQPRVRLNQKQKRQLTEAIEIIRRVEGVVPGHDSEGSTLSREVQLLSNVYTNLEEVPLVDSNTTDE